MACIIGHPLPAVRWDGRELFVSHEFHKLMLWGTWQSPHLGLGLCYHQYMVVPSKGQACPGVERHGSGSQQPFHLQLTQHKPDLAWLAPEGPAPPVVGDSWDNSFSLGST